MPYIDLVLHEIERKKHRPPPLVVVLLAVVRHWHWLRKIVSKTTPLLVAFQVFFGDIHQPLILPRLHLNDSHIVQQQVKYL